MNAPVLEIDDLTVDFHMPEGVGCAVDHLSLTVENGETIGLVGESGCGKSMTALSILGLIPQPFGKVRFGSIRYAGENLLTAHSERLRRIRGSEIAMIFQEPMTSLNPVLTIGRQVAEPLMEHKGLNKTDAYAEALAWLEHVKLPAAREQLSQYPHQLSGGMRQRVMIAMAMVCRPRLLIADEPTTALDVTIQSQILSLMMGLKEELGMGILLITHDLGVVAQMARRVVVMYAGQVMEEADVEILFEQPFHPYTQGLMQSIPRGLKDDRGRKIRLNEIPGNVLPITEKVGGCKFSTRCPSVFETCINHHPSLKTISGGHRVRCWLLDDPDRRR
ncbi:MAG: ABC transporter ATP-binding protein [Desulfobacteraceae bacterium]|nr:ABC transporter ATP-binding protein [Desulfobacteraceae bacterium]